MSISVDSHREAVAIGIGWGRSYENDGGDPVKNKSALWSDLVSL